MKLVFKGEVVSFCLFKSAIFKNLYSQSELPIKTFLI